MRPLAIELFAGRFGWGKGFVAEGWRVVGFDILHEPYHGNVPEGCSLALQDVLALHGRQFREASAIVASPPCQAYSFMAMPFRRAKREIKWKRWEWESEFSPGFHLNDLFEACYRIQHEASKAAGRYIPIVIENVRGTQPWVGRSRAKYGSFHLWGDVESVGDRVVARGARFGDTLAPARSGVSEARGILHVPGLKGGGGGWFDANASMMRKGTSKGAARKAASAAIAEIPFALSSYLARCFHPDYAKVRVA